MDALERFGEPTGDALLSEDESATDGSPATPPGTVPRQRVVDYSACRLWNAIAERTQLRIDSENVAYRLEVRGGEAVRIHLSHARARGVSLSSSTTCTAKRLRRSRSCSVRCA